MSTSPARHGESRGDLVARLGWHSPGLHVAALLGLAIAAIAVVAWRVRAPTLYEWATIPITFLSANAAEWRLHRSLLHRRVRWLTFAYELHARQHHGVFRYHDMALRHRREVVLVVMPLVLVVLLIALTAPLAWAIGLGWSSNRGWLVFATATTTLVAYELMHLAYHLPPDGVVGRVRLIAALREHHRRHHHPRLMKRWNFNVTFPIFDFLHATIVPASELERVLAEDEELDTGGASVTRPPREPSSTGDHLG